MGYGKSSVSGGVNPALVSLLSLACSAGAPVFTPTQGVYRLSDPEPNPFTFGSTLDLTLPVPTTMAFDTSWTLLALDGRSFSGRRVLRVGTEVDTGGINFCGYDTGPCHSRYGEFADILGAFSDETHFHAEVVEFRLDEQGDPIGDSTAYERFSFDGAWVGEIEGDAE